MDKPKILIAAPQHVSKMYAFEEYTANLRLLTFENVDLYFSDNSETEENSLYIKSLGFNCSWLPPIEGETIFERIARSHNDCRKVFLEGDYTHLLHLETDVICPIDTIERLLAFEKPIVSGYYDIYFGENRQPMIMTIDYHHKRIKSFRAPTYIEHEEPMFFDGSLKEVFQCGLGCVLIRRDVMQMLEFRVKVGEKISSADTYFYNDLYANNVPVYLDTTLSCNHNNISWKNHLI
jgi:hypothetical protein